MPFDLISIPTKIGLVALGAMFACVFALFYSLYITRKYANKLADGLPVKRKYLNLTESAIIGLFVGISLLISRFFKLDNPYWVPISCAAIMQGANVSHVWRRSFHRIAGTAVGMGLIWVFWQFNLSLLSICITILILQFIIEMLVVRHYALAVIFITPLTFFLGELGSGTAVHYNQLVSARLTDIIIGSLIGVAGGWILHNQQLHQKAERHIRKTRIAILRK
ncbi:MAG: FUSC family protein [Ginsengibacter sp.]